MNVLTIDFKQADAGEQLVTSLHETGFAILRSHPISEHLLDSIYEQWQAFFDSDAKFEYAHDPDREADIQSGFYSTEVSEKAVGATQKDNKEFYHVVPGEGLPPELAKNILAYREQAMRLGKALLLAIQDHAPDVVTACFAEPIASVLSDSATLLRILHYPKLDADAEVPALRAAPHEDINFLTILPVAKEPGLQVMNQRDEWIDLEGFVGDLIINNGDMLQEASGGYFPSTTHRVTNPGADSDNVSRISLPLFLTPNLNFVLSDRYTAGSYLRERLALISGQSAAE